MRKQSKIDFIEFEEDRQNIVNSEEVQNEIEAVELKKKIYEIVETFDPISKSIFIMQKELGMSMMKLQRI